MRKICRTAVLLMTAMLAMQTISFPIYALKDNKYIINKRKDRREYYDITYSWEWFYSQDEDNTITLYYRHRFPPDMGLVALGYIGEPYFSGTVIVPDQINGTTVTWVQGSCSAVGFDVNPENKYMECVDNVIFSKDRKTLMSYPQNISETSYSIPNRDEQNASPKSERRRMKKPLERSRRKTRTAKQTLVKKDKSRLKNMKSMQLSNAFDGFQATVRTIRFSDNGS